MKSSYSMAVAAVVFAVGAYAQQTDGGHAAHHPPAVASAPMADGEVRKVDKEQSKLTLKHGPIANLDMPGMTMVFRVADLKLLEGLKEGDKVKFAADRINGAITVTAIESAR
jgi:Cu(I)/Ag(I) efflux system periplasmic protein CusF